MATTYGHLLCKHVKHSIPRAQAQNLLDFKAVHSQETERPTHLSFKLLDRLSRAAKATYAVIKVMPRALHNDVRSAGSRSNTRIQNPEQARAKRILLLTMLKIAENTTTPAKQI
jgi:hypothetical protein